MPTGKVKWYDAEKGFGFLSKDDGRRRLRARRRAARRARRPQARHPGGVRRWSRAARATRRCRCGCSSRSPSVAKAVSKSHRKKPADMVNIIEDLYGLLEGVERAYRAGRHPDAKVGQADREGAARAGRRARALSQAVAGAGRRAARPPRHTSRRPGSRRRRRGRAAGTSGSAMPMKPPTTQDSWSSVSERANVPARRALGDLALDQRVERQLAQRLGEPGGEPEQHRGRQPVEHARPRPPPRRRPAASTTTVTCGLIRRSTEPSAMPMVLPRPADADHQAEQQRRLVLPAGERLVAQQERHEHRQEPAQQPQPGVGAQRDHDAVRQRRTPAPSAGPAPRATSVLAGGAVHPGRQQDRQDGARRRTPGTRSAATTAARTSRPPTASGAEIAAPDDRGQRDAASWP